jgi:GNAT superfamily N-acetyltransferase
MIEIKKMKESEFDIVIDNPADGYAQGIADTEGISFELASKKAAEQLAELLPKGINTENHYFYSAYDRDSFVGYAWVNIKPETKNAWGYNIFVKEEFRRKGIAKEIFNVLQPVLKNMGVKQISFHVFAKNKNAISLYEQCGFEISNIVMKKEL